MDNLKKVYKPLHSFYTHLNKYPYNVYTCIVYSVYITYTTAHSKNCMQYIDRKQIKISQRHCIKTKLVTGNRRNKKIGILSSLNMSHHTLYRLIKINWKYHSCTS